MKAYFLRNIPVKFCKNPVNGFCKTFFKNKKFTDACTDERTDGCTTLTIARWSLASGAKTH